MTFLPSAYLARLDTVYAGLMTAEQLGCPVFAFDYNAQAPDISPAALERLLVAALQHAGVLGA